jgi:adenylate kinase
VRILLIAPPGAGKGTQATRLAEHFGVAHIASGDLFRQHVAAGDELGQQVRAYVEQGDLVPDDVVMAMIGPPVIEAATAGGYVLDGFPRTVAQAEAARAGAKPLGVEVQAAVSMSAPDAVLLDRLLERGRQAGRIDDSEATIRHRLEVYHQKTEPLIAYYRSLGILVAVDADQPVDEVFGDILAGIADLGVTPAAR